MREIINTVNRYKICSNNLLIHQEMHTGEELNSANVQKFTQVIVRTYNKDNHYECSNFVKTCRSVHYFISEKVT